MAVTVETLDKLERKITLTLPADAIKSEVDSRLKRLARTVKMDGFRPGKVPFAVVAQRYGYSVQFEVMNDKVGEAFEQAANEANLRVAGQPRITEKVGAPEGQFAFDAVFEVYPEVKIGDLTTAEAERITTEVSEDAVEKTIDILRKQRRMYTQRPHDAPAEDGDRIVVDYEGTIDGEAFAGGKGTDHLFSLGDGQMLKVFEDAVRGMKTGESKTFPLAFPDDYHGREVAGKTADFMVTIKKIEQGHLPEVDDALAKALGVAGGTVEALRADIKRNLDREVRFRLVARNKKSAMDALLSRAELDVPKAVVTNEIARLIQRARDDLRTRGVRDVEKLPMPEELFQAEAERRVRLGLTMAEIVRENKMRATPEQIRQHVEELSASYERPTEVFRWYYAEPGRLGEVEAIVMENMVADFVLAKATVTDKHVPFDELMKTAD